MLNNSFSLEQLFPIISEQLENGGSAVFCIHGTSMLPLLKDGKDSVRLIKPISKPKKYDIIFYRRENGAFVLHRIVGIKNGCYICRGDNQIENEFPVKNDWVIGILTDYTKKGKWISAKTFKQFIYSRIQVNTVFYRRLKHKIKSIIKKGTAK